MSKPFEQLGLTFLISLWAGLGLAELIIGVMVFNELGLPEFCLQAEHWFLILLSLTIGGSGLLGMLVQRRNRWQQEKSCQGEDFAIKSEQALQESEDRFRAIFEQAAVGMVLMTLEGHFFRVNQTVSQILGYDRPELLALTFKELLPTEEEADYQQTIEQLKQGQLSHLSQETQILHKDQTLIWVQITLTLVRDRQTQEPKYFLGAFEEIHRRKQVETALQESEERFRQLADTVQDVFWLYEPEQQKLLYVNQAYERVWGRSCDSAYESPLSWLEAIHPDDRKAVLQSLTLQSQGIDTEKEFRIIRPDGTVKWLCDRAFPIVNNQGEVHRVAGISTDITERKQTEHALQEKQHFIEKITNSTPNILYIYDLLDRCSVYANQKISSVLGYDANIPLNQQFLKQVMHPDDLACLSSYYQQLQAAQDGDIFEIEYRLKDIQGEWHWFVSRDTVFARTADGKPQQILGTASDITDRKVVESALLQANLQLHEKVNELETRNAEMQLLEEMNEFLQVCSSVKGACEGIVDYLHPMFPNCTGSLYLLERESQHPELVAHWGQNMASDSTSPLPMNVEQLEDCYAATTSPPSQNYLCLPMVALGDTLGYLYIQENRFGELTEAKRRFARTVTEHLALALANLELRENLRSQSVRDPLTGLYNRRYMEESLEQEIRRAKRGDHTVGVILLDVDRFKQFNDTFGHNAGDRVLRVLSHFLKRNIRGSDVACRYGGEELLLILPEATVADSHQRAEQIRQRVERLQFKHHGQRLGSVTISLGIAIFPDHGTTGEAVVQSADKALYLAKNNGRNCTMVYGV
ncbi:diguanylate cyclase [Spirulina sp. CS-785/01]|uniref:GGDEF domain-containing protein n=1 Tax=Spirulina sp. CS-785/01 TaxID=3021716 RepID=UPI00232B47E0|nr:sensor domain-containing diguanylate cyclase [Spirulina sp. CS-785/01]MDB9314009.1 diguanylate cyclase [Spirulina sp. CS-785/01]